MTESVLRDNLVELRPDIVPPPVLRLSDTEEGAAMGLALGKAMGTRLIFSCPPAKTTSACPDIIFMAAKQTTSRPVQQRRSMVMPGITVFITALRAP